MFRETPLVLEMFVKYGAGDSDDGECARLARHTFATRLVTLVPNVSPAPFVTCFKHNQSHHGNRQVYDHVRVSFDIVIE